MEGFGIIQAQVQILSMLLSCKEPYVPHLGYLLFDLLQSIVNNPSSQGYWVYEQNFAYPYGAKHSAQQEVTFNK